ncbi:MAG: 5'/3'-nucleotidase SurE [Clostridia bacterium]|nr:5'/3'-nucleotidase SurE [Clostridia bacterium]
MHLFLVNDDGIGSKGIMALACAAVARGYRVTLCAPATQQSAASQRITLAAPIFVAPYPVEYPLMRAYAITGSPADCVRLGLQDLVEAPVDVLISGINNGYNYGMAVHYSGTVGAAREGALYGLHAIAASIHEKASPELIQRFADYVMDVAGLFLLTPLPATLLLSINAPNSPSGRWKKPVMAPLCTANFTDRYIRRESPRAGTYYWLDSGARTQPPVPGSDQDMLRKGHITLTCMGNPSDQRVGFNCLDGFDAACQNLGEWL